MGTKTRLQAPARLNPLLTLTLAATLGVGAPGAVLAQVAKTGTAAPPAAAAPASGSAPGPAPGTSARAAPRPTVGCLIGPEAVADIGTPVTGLVAFVAVDRGDTVRTGQTLIQLENEVERNNFEAARSRATMDADVRAAEANVALARQRHVRATELVDKGFASPQTLEQALAEHEVAAQKLQQARSQKTVTNHELGLVKAQLSQRTLKSPFNGVVIERFVSPGERAEDKPLLRLAMLDPLRVELVMPATRWGSVAVGDSVPIVPELPGANALKAQVSHIDKIIDAASNTFRVRLALPNPGNRLPAGARCRVEGAAGGLAAAPGAAVTPTAVRPASGTAAPGSTPAAHTLPTGGKPAAAPAALLPRV